MEGKKNLNVCVCVTEQRMCKCVVLFLALKLRYRLLRVFGNMSVNNGLGSSDRCSIDSSNAC